ncbi:MAG: AAA family ATPase [Actinomycetota bacterium]
MTDRTPMQIMTLLGRDDAVTAGVNDAAITRERTRQRRLWKLFAVLGPIAGFLWYRIAIGDPFNPFALPSVPVEFAPYLPIIFISVLLIGVMLGPMIGAGGSPHIAFTPEQIDVTFDDVRGIDPVKSEVIRTLNLFLAHKMFRDTMGGSPRRGLLFEGAPGTGKTHLAKAMAHHAGVPFLFVSGPAFQSMWYGMTARKIRRFFKTVKKTARKEGGCIAFIEEIDAFATKRGSMDGASALASMTPTPGGITRNASISEGTGGTVNELLIQMQSFDEPSAGDRFVNRCKDSLNAFLPPAKRLKKRPPEYANVLVIAATNRGDALDPALLRPGRFDRRLHFDLPSRSGRCELVELFLSKKAHDPSLQDPERVDEISALTFGYTPVMIERLFDEALMHALREGRTEMRFEDLSSAKLSIELGLPNPQAYTPKERHRVATHEAGHAVCAYRAGIGRKMEVLSIIKRKDALGLLGHSETEERFTKTTSELEGLLVTAMGGIVAEETYCGETSTGPAGDLAHATQIAAEMVGSLGLGGSLISFRAPEQGPFDPGLVGRVLADGKARAAVEEILDRAKARAKEILEGEPHLLDALRDALLERDELVGDEILEVLRDASLG